MLMKSFLKTQTAVTKRAEKQPSRKMRQVQAGENTNILTFFNISHQKREIETIVIKLGKFEFLEGHAETSKNELNRGEQGRSVGGFGRDVFGNADRFFHT
mgnify:CR=1 FL=1